MTAIASFRLTEGSAPYPARGTAPAADDQMFWGGTIVSLNASGEAVVPVDGDGFHAFGVMQASLDGRAGKPNENADVEVHYGVFGFNIDGATPKPKDVLYVVDNCTVSTDSDGGQRGVAGICVEVRDNVAGVAQAYLYIGPLAYLPADVADVTASESIGHIPIAISSGRLAAGTSPGAFDDGVADGFVVSEGLRYRWNVASTAALWFECDLPQELDEAENVEIHMLVSREGASDVTAVVTATAFFIVAAAAYTADSNAGGNSGAIDQATTVVSEETIVLAAADVPAGPCTLKFSLVPSAALDADDLNLHAVWVEYTKAL